MKITVTKTVQSKNPLRFSFAYAIITVSKEFNLFFGVSNHVRNHGTNPRFPRTMLQEW